MDRPPPRVIEIVSTAWRGDYIAKVSEYERTQIPEYWIIGRSPPPTTRVNFGASEAIRRSPRPCFLAWS
ncbi:MAG: hypothetical protein HC838_01900 [Spirulinaceae cyanobacterium RM2_2_10]|nr:hypothetical protein [Spirulinaceae cyanobacterium SM2_1_0]NJO19062.1 hypothetical protein [Spirulinaceae cyanobacterium RM2_2_10]